MAYVVMARIVMAYIGMARKVMIYVVKAYNGVAYIVMAYIVMSHGLLRNGARRDIEVRIHICCKSRVARCIAALSVLRVAAPAQKFELRSRCAS